jgi:hypothetical protein
VEKVDQCLKVVGGVWHWGLGRQFKRYLATCASFQGN